MANATEFAPDEEVQISADMPSAMKGLAISALAENQMLQTRGW